MRWFLLAVALLVSAPSQAQNLQLLGAGATGKISSASYVGPGDIKSGAIAWYSCARAYTAAFAATLGAICDVVDTSTGLTTCTFHIQATGFVNPAECNATACATACSVTKAYDQSGNGRDVSNATLSGMPLVEFSALNGLPGMKCASTGTVCLLITAANITQAQPVVVSAVMKRQGAFTTAQDFFGCNGASNPHMGFTTSTNTAFVNGGSSLTATASDGDYHSINGLLNGNGTSSAINVDGTDTTGAAGTAGCSAQTIRVHRTPNQSQGTIMEGGMWASAWSATDRGNISSNQHGTNGYNF